MSEKRCWRCDVYEAKTEDGQCPKCSGVFGHDAWAKMYVMLNQQADELREAQAGAAALREIAGLWPAGLSEIDELAYDSQGKWASVSTENAPKWTHGYKRILAEIESVKQDRHTRFSTTTAGADLLAELDTLRTQNRELRESLLNVAGWLLSYTEQNLVAKESPLFYELMMKYGKLAATTAGIREGTQQEMFDQIHPKRKALGEAK